MSTRKFFTRRGNRLPRQTNGKPRALPFPAFDLDATAMQIDGQLDEIKPDAGADDARDIAAAIVATEDLVEVPH